ncbi:hypothetical protein A4X09_0g7644 [Tilletia walkeri]|uniref:Uncharacterized protein n=1 Tax=Tilletia walkeri TaxID=117179 RepID=A0A8X7T1V9_9BASI|nr:hypothetical protein A4X09_0g7644 [Tilletia walkeri]
MGTARRWQRLGRQVHAVSRDDVSGDEVKDDPVRQGAATQRTVTPRRHTMRQYGGRLGTDKAGRVVMQGEPSRTSLHSPAFFRTGTAPQDTSDKRGSPAVTSTRQDEDGGGCGERRCLLHSVRQDDG